MIRTALLIACFIALASSSPFEPHYNQTLIKNAIDWSLMKAPITQQMSGRTFTRLLIKLPLYLLFPIPSNLVDFRSSQILTEITPKEVKCVSNSLEFYFFIDSFNDHKEIYSLTSIKRPTNVIVKFHLNTNLFGEQFQKLVTINAQMISINYRMKYMFSFKVKNVAFGKVFTMEGRMLNYFRKSLWGFERSTDWFEENSNLDIVSYTPHSDFRSMTVEIGSDLPFSKRLLALVQAKNENLEQCNSTQIKELDWFKAETDLEMDLCSVAYRDVDYDYTPEKQYQVENHYNLTICVSSECKRTIQTPSETTVTPIPRPPPIRRVTGFYKPWWTRIF